MDLLLEEYIVHMPKDWFKSNAGCKNWAIELIKLTSPIDCKYDAWKIGSIDSLSYSYCVTKVSLCK